MVQVKIPGIRQEILLTAIETTSHRIANSAIQIGSTWPCEKTADTPT